MFVLLAMNYCVYSKSRTEEYGFTIVSISVFGIRAWGEAGGGGGVKTKTKLVRQPFNFWFLVSPPPPPSPGGRAQGRPGAHKLWVSQPL